MLVKAAERHIGDFNAQEFASTAWAFATDGLPNAELFAVLVMAAERRIGDFNEQELVNSAWLFSTARFPNAELFAVLAKAVERRIEDFNALDPVILAPAMNLMSGVCCWPAPQVVDSVLRTPVRAHAVNKWSQGGHQVGQQVAI